MARSLHKSAPDQPTAAAGSDSEHPEDDRLHKMMSIKARLREEAGTALLASLLLTFGTLIRRSAAGLGRHTSAPSAAVGAGLGKYAKAWPRRSSGCSK